MPGRHRPSAPMIAAESRVLAHNLDSTFWPADPPVTYHNNRGLLDLLEASTREDVVNLLRAPTVIDAIGDITLDVRGECAQTLARILKKNFPSPPGPPRKAAEKRVDIQTIHRVMEVMSR